MILPDMEVLEPGKEIMAQLRAAASIVPATGDRFVIRHFSSPRSHWAAASS